MMPRLVFVLLLALFTQICVGSEFTAFCDVCRKVNPETACPENLACSDGSVEYDGVVGVCSSDNKHITSLKATNKGLTEIPDSVNELEYITLLNLAGNKIEKLPVLGGLRALKTVYLYNNELESVTGVFVNSTRLASFSIAGNKLNELPPEFSEFNLTSLAFDNNNVSEIPESYASLTDTLGVLRLDQNMLNCSTIKKTFPGTIFAEKCVQVQQKIEETGPVLPLVYPDDPASAGLDAYEIVSIILFVIFVCLLVVAIVLYKRYRGNGGAASA